MAQRAEDDDGRTDRTGPDGGPGTEPRRGDLRPLIAVVIIVFAGLRLGAEVSYPALVLGALAILAAGAVAARPARSTSRRARAAPLPVVWPNDSMKAMAEALPEPCIITDAKGVVRFANTHANLRFGTLQPGDPLNFRLRATALNDTLEDVVTLDRAVTVEWHEKIPTERWLEAHVAPIHLQSDPYSTLRRPDFVIVVIEDQTEQHRSERMRADFVANASHELRTPLASLTGFIETLQGPARNDVNARERFLAIMAEQAARMKRLIDDLLSLSRIELKAHVRPDQQVDLQDVLGHVMDSLGPLASENDVDIEPALPATPMPVIGDRDELVQLFSNLIENAIKYGASGGRIDVTAMAEAQPGGTAFWWLVTVRDFGPGIPAEHLPRLTERFYRADVDSSRRKQGTGLGLAIVKHILTRHRGRLAIDSTLGAGATFSVRLEAAAQAATPLTDILDPRAVLVRDGADHADRRAAS